MTLLVTAIVGPSVEAAEAEGTEMEAIDLRAAIAAIDAAVSAESADVATLNCDVAVEASAAAAVVVAFEAVTAAPAAEAADNVFLAVPVVVLRAAVSSRQLTVAPAMAAMVMMTEK